MIDLENMVKELVGGLEIEIDFKPVKPKAPVSGLVGEMRNEREDSISR